MTLEYLHFLTQSEVEAIHQASLEILDRVGVILSQPSALRFIQDAGGRVAANRVFIPHELVEWALAQVPDRVSLRGRNGLSAVIGDGSLHWHNLGGAAMVYEPDVGRCFPASVEDVQKAACLLDALPAVTTMTPFFTPQDVPGPLMSLAMYRHSLPYTEKPLHGPGVQNPAEVRYAFEMAAIFGVPDEVLSIAISPLSPLFFPDELVEAIIETARLGLLFIPLPCPTAGATAPLSIVGAVAQQNAEILASIVLAELVHPGLPVVYCGRLAMMEPRTALSVWGGVELGLASAATVQLAHRYHLPVNVYGFSTNSMQLNLQNGYERALNALLPALAGADELSGIGEMQAGVAGSYAQMVIDDEIAGSIRRACRGFSITPDSLAVDIIAEIMDGKRNFLDQPHTVKYLRSGEVYVTKLAERGTWEDWERQGRPDMVKRAQQRAQNLLNSHQPLPLDETQEKELQVIYDRAWQELV